MSHLNPVLLSSRKQWLSSALTGLQDSPQLISSTLSLGSTSSTWARQGTRLGSPAPSRLIWQPILSSELPAELPRLWALRCEALPMWAYSRPPSCILLFRRPSALYGSDAFLFVFCSWKLPHKPLILYCLAKQAFPFIESTFSFLSLLV